MMKNTWIIPLISCLLLNSCTSRECETFFATYEFQIPATLTPAADTISIGDTITITSIFSKEVFEENTGNFYTLEDFSFYPSTSIRKIDTVPAGDGLGSFEYLAESSINYAFTAYTSVSLIDGQYSFNGNEYSLVFKLVAKESGSFFLKHAVSPHIQSEQDFEGRCWNIDIDGTVNMNAGDDNNIDMLRDSPDPHFSDWILLKPEKRFHKFGGYCFYVRPR